MITKTEVTETGKNRSVVMYESFHELLEKNLEEDFRSKAMRQDGSGFYGVKDMQEAHELAKKGLPHLGVETIKLASNKVADMQGDMIQPQFFESFDVSGAVVDMGRYMEGTPECMVDYRPVDQDVNTNIVSLIMNITYHCGISADAITKNGQAMMALVEAIELQGKQAEIWVDQHAKDWTGDYLARTAVRLKKAGEPFDVGMFMYALTHPSFLRAHIFNAMHQHPEKFKDEIGITPRGGYGGQVRGAAEMDDFPPYSIYIPVISENKQAGKFVTEVLGKMGLMAA